MSTQDLKTLKLEACSGNVIIRPYKEPVKPYYMPYDYRVPFHAGEVLAAGPVSARKHTTVKKGDTVLYNIPDPFDFERGIYHKFPFGNEDLICCDEVYLRGILRHKNMNQVDFAKDVEALGIKVFVERQVPIGYEALPSGNLLHIEGGYVVDPKDVQEKDTTFDVVKVLSAGESNRKIFVNPDDIEVGKLYLLGRNPTVNLLPTAGYNHVFQVNGMDLLAKWNEETEEWDPIADWVLLEHLSLEWEKIYDENPFDDSGEKIYYWQKIDDPDVKMTDMLADITEVYSQFAKVIRIGKGITMDHPKGRIEKHVGSTRSIRPGDIIWTGPVLNNQAEYAGFAHKYTLGEGTDQFLFPMNEAKGIQRL